MTDLVVVDILLTLLTVTDLEVDILEMVEDLVEVVVMDPTEVVVAGVGEEGTEGDNRPCQVVFSSLLIISLVTITEFAHLWRCGQNDILMPDLNDYHDNSIDYYTVFILILWN